MISKVIIFAMLTDVCGNWIEIAYGTSSGTVRVIVQHPETVGHGPQLFQTFTVHRFPVTKVSNLPGIQFHILLCFFIDNKKTMLNFHTTWCMK